MFTRLSHRFSLEQQFVKRYLPHLHTKQTGKSVFVAGTKFMTTIANFAGQLKRLDVATNEKIGKCELGTGSPQKAL